MPKTVDAIPVVTKAMVRRVRRALGPRYWRKVSTRKLTLHNYRGGWKELKIGQISFGKGRSWEEAFQIVLEGARQLRVIGDQAR